MQAEKGARLQTVINDTAAWGQRLAALESKVRDIQTTGSTASTNDSGRVPALIMGGWPPDTLASEVLDKANAMARDLKLELNLQDSFVPGVRRGFVLIPRKPQQDETEEGMRPWKNRKATGVDGVAQEALRAMFDDPGWRPRIAELLNDAFYRGEISEWIAKGASVLLPTTLLHHSQMALPTATLAGGPRP